jgi:hypothetical protein
VAENDGRGPGARRAAGRARDEDPPGLGAAGAPDGSSATAGACVAATAFDAARARAAPLRGVGPAFVPVDFAAASTLAAPLRGVFCFFACALPCDA